MICFLHRSAVSAPVSLALEEEHAVNVESCSGEIQMSNAMVGSCHVNYSTL